jgi:predicted transcriptional regulator
MKTIHHDLDALPEHFFRRIDKSGSFAIPGAFKYNTIN